MIQFPVDGDLLSKMHVGLITEVLTAFGSQCFHVQDHLFS